MKEFKYLRAGTINEALTLLNEPGTNSRPLAGGTDLAVLLRANPNLCDRVVDISLIPELHAIQQENGWVKIGAAVTFTEIIENRAIQETAPILIQACSQIGAVQIRNMGTLGGNICNAAVCADSLPALVCLDALAHIQTPAGKKVMPVAELVVGPNQTRLLQGELLIAFSYQVPDPSNRSVFIKLGRRNAMAISRLTVAVIGRMNNLGKIAEVRIVAGAVTPQTNRMNEVEKILLDQYPNQTLFAQAASQVNEEVIRDTGRRWSSEYKEPALMTLMERALASVFSDAPAGKLEI
jgi:CO/xanthine dehydrogenase FAD-binding subunit